MKNYLHFNFKAFIFLTISFVMMTVVGTLSHELGHYSVAKILGYESRINYGSVSWKNDKTIKYIRETGKKYHNEIKNKTDFPNKEMYYEKSQKLRKDKVWFTLGGPLQTMITGTIGLVLLWYYRKKYITKDKVHFFGWVFIFMTLFWLRQPANLFSAIIGFLEDGKISFSGDEVVLAYYFGMNLWKIQIVTGIIGAEILIFVLSILPKKILLTFLVSGLVGGILGFYLWLIKFGPLILP